MTVKLSREVKMKLLRRKRTLMETKVMKPLRKKERKPSLLSQMKNLLISLRSLKQKLSQKTSRKLRQNYSQKPSQMQS